jgi:PTH2 family peptidyl-tRNA hydrolase
MKNPVMYILVNKGLGMSTGKVAAQVAHAACRSIHHAVDRKYRDEAVHTVDAADLGAYFDKGETKIVLEVRDTEHLLMAERYLNEHGIKTFLVIDEGRTEIAPHSPTAMATEIVDKADENVQFALGDFKTYKDPKPEQEIIEDRPRFLGRLR